MRIATFLLIALLATAAQGAGFGNTVSTWSQQYGKGASYSAVQGLLALDDGTFVTAGTISQSLAMKWAGGAARNIQLIRVDANGSVTWARVYTPFGVQSPGTARNVKRLADGNLIAVGVTGDRDRKGKTDAFLLKLAPDGKQIWARKYGSDNDEEEASDVIPTKDGGFLVFGKVGNYKSNRAWVFKVDAKGIFQGQSLFDKTVESTIAEVDGGYLLAGSNLVKIDTSGRELWRKPVDGYISHLEPTGNGDFLMLGGKMKGKMSLPRFGSIAPDGSMRWSKLYADKQKRSFYFTDVVPTSQGYMMTGVQYKRYSDGTGTFVMGVDKTGKPLWKRAARAQKGGMLLSQIVPTPDGGYLIGGSTNTDYLISHGKATYISESVLIKLDGEGKTPMYKDEPASNVMIIEES